MRDRLFPTQEVGSLQRPYWLQGFGRQRQEQRTVEDAVAWGKRLRVDEVGELANGSGTGLLQKPLGSITDADRERAKEIATIYAIRMQESAGLDILFNGEQQRTEMYSFMANFVNGMSEAGVLNAFDANYFTKFSIDGDVSVSERGDAFFAREFAFARKHTGRTLKPCLTGAYTMVDWSYLEHYMRRNGSPRADMEKAKESAVISFADNVVRPLIRTLSVKGAAMVQIDEPAAATNEAESRIFVESLNRSFEGAWNGMEKAVHLCYSDYRRLFPHIADSKATLYLIEFTNHATNTFEALRLFREYGIKAKIGVGVVDIHTDAIESPEKIRDDILMAAKMLGDPSLVSVNPDCGLRTRRPEIAYAKLCSMVKGAELARREFGE
ncbi:MAG: hypothetical protein KGH98_01925 [Candidatus Micrarchaeota archaeon]|nr:hypothetical protein [Candidatus Micrarchaeota archaeon]